MSATPNLAEHLVADGPDLDLPEQRKAWRIDDDAAANWALRRLAAAEAEKSRIRHLAQVEINRVETWADDTERAIAHDVDYFTSQLIDYRRRLEDDDPTLPQTYRLPAGSIARRKAVERVVVEDHGEFLDWALDNDHDLLTVRSSLSAIKAAVGDKYAAVPAAEDGEQSIVLMSTGEVLPGVRLVRGADTYQAKPATDGGPFA